VKDILSLGAVNTYRGPAHILRDVSLVVGEGETVCLIGRNGAGKTTAMESVMGLLPLRSGTIMLDGQEITRLGPHSRARRGIGYAPDDCGIFPELTVAENLGIGYWLAETSHRAGGGGAQATREETIYALFPELPRLLQRRGLHLSGGERKMVAIARCMALGPSVLLLDEAFEGLAPMVVNRFAEAVQRIKAMGISMLIAESNVTTAAKVADRFYVIDRGEIIFQGAPAEVFANKEIMQVIRG